MADSAARIAEIKHALTSTGKSVSAYSQKFAAGEAPEQVQARAAQAEGGVATLGDDEVQVFLDQLTTLAKAALRSAEAKARTRAQDLSGRSSGRNADDVVKLNAGLERLGATWSSAREQMEQQALAAALAELHTAPPAPAANEDAAREVKEAQARAAAAEAAAAAATASAAAAERARADAIAAASASEARAAAAEASMAELQAKLREAEASLAAAHTFDVSATVEEATPSSPPPKPTEPAVAASMTIAGSAVLGGTLRVSGATSLPYATYQWVRLSKSGAQDPIGGATRQQYAPEPRDVGAVLACAVTPAPGEPVALVATTGPLAEMEGLGAAVAALTSKESAEFNCVVVQRNGEMQDRREVHQLEVLGDRVKLKRAGKTRFKEAYGEGMQVFMLACESAKQRNAAILLIRDRARERGFQVLGPKDKQDAAK